MSRRLRPRRTVFQGSQALAQRSVVVRDRSWRNFLFGVGGVLADRVTFGMLPC